MLDGYEFNIRDLYNFFDDNLIMIEVQVDFTRQHYGNPLYAYRVNFFHSDDDITNWSELYRGRPEAEEEAFKLAFEILNDKLTTNE